MKKVLLLVVALAALALPASASAYSTWTFDGGETPEGFKIPEGFIKGEEYAGNFSWVEWSGGVSHPVFTCKVKLEITAKTEGGSQQAWVSKFERNSCGGQGSYSGCKLAESYDNFSSGWNVDFNPSGTPIITSPSGFVEIRDKFVYPGSCPTTGKSAKWGNGGLKLVPTVEKNTSITQVVMEGQTEQGIVNYTFGPLTRVYSFPYALGLE